jgi:GWxTD domain-containing protein
MKSISTLFSLGLMLITVSHAQKLDAYYDLKKFNVPDADPYVDVQISFIGTTVVYDSTGFANIESTLIVKKGKKIIDFRKTHVKHQSAQENPQSNFIDLQRFSLENGKYSLEIYLRDLNDNQEDTIKVNQPFEIFFSGNKPEYSDIQLLNKLEKIDASDKNPSIYHKAGYTMIPYVSDYYPPGMNEIQFYAEVYNTRNALGSDKKFVSIVEITDEGKNVISNFRTIRARKTAKVTPILGQFDISNLYSGTYLLHLEVRDENNEPVVDQSISFFRNNPMPAAVYSETAEIREGDFLFSQLYSNRDTLIDYIKSLRPRAEMLEQSIIDKQIESASTDELQQFLYTFWLKRSPSNPEAAWTRYKELVRIVNEEYSTQIMRGYDTDRGRVFLQYGKPDQLVSVPKEPNAYPYEIWMYYHIGNFNNRRFVFYNRDLSSNDYQLLHSDMRGEPYNAQWNVILHSRTNPIPGVDTQQGIDNFGSRAQEYYIDPR